MNHVVIQPLNRFKVLVVSRHRTVQAARKKEEKLGLKNAVYEMTSGDIPKAGEAIDREELRERFVVVVGDPESKPERPDSLKALLAKRKAKEG